MPWLLSTTLAVAGIMLPALFYIGWRMRYVLQSFTSNQKITNSPIYILSSFYLLPLIALFHHVLAGNPDLLAYPKPLVYWFWFGLIVSFQLASGFIILDVVRLGIQWSAGWNTHRMHRIYGRAAVAMMTILVAYTTIKMGYDTRQVEVERHTYNADATFAEGLRVVHITDLQGDEFTGREEIEAYIKKVNTLEPDLVVFTGDLISYGTDFIDMAAEELARVEATYGLYSVLGDHDYWAGVPNIQAAFDRYGIPLVKDENVFIPINGDSLLLTGITEVYSKHIPREQLRNLTKAASQSPARILITHQATEKVVEAAREAGYSMVLGGHTHGGQLFVPFLGMGFSAAERETEYVSGIYQAGKLFININNGLGFTLAPIRYGAQPNISVIDFQ